MERFYISENNFKQIEEPDPTLGLDVPEYLEANSPPRLAFKVKLGEKSFRRALNQLLEGNSSYATLFHNGTSRKLMGECFIDSLSDRCHREGTAYTGVLTFCGPVTLEIK